MITSIGKHLLSGMIVLLVSMQAHARAAILEELPQSRIVGSGELTWMGMTVYRASLYAPEGRYSPDQPHAIKINYQLKFSRERMAQRSLKEIEEIFGTQSQREKMVQQLTSVFCDVAKGDHITGVHYPGKGADFYCNDDLYGRLDDAKLAAAFFAIWLNSRTSEPRLRGKLLGKSK